MREPACKTANLLTMPAYFISGLRVSSELDLPGAIADASQAKNPAVFIRRSRVPASLGDATATGPTWEMAGESFLLRVPRLARFLITAGRQIEVDVDPGTEERDAAGFILGTAFGILLHQRGALVLHGAAVAKGDRAIAICGASGSGKSTLDAALCCEDCSFAADDICVIALDERRRPVVMPDGRQLKLWKESIDKLRLAARQGDAVRQGFEKYFIESLDTSAAPPRLSAIYVLRDARPPLTEGIERLSLPDAIRALEFEAYRPGLRAKMGQKPEMFAHTAATFGHATAFLLIRQRGFEHMAGTVASVRAHWDALG
jgi:hypothetical protein